MLTLPPSVRVYVAAEPTDLRKSFDGLSALVAPRFGEDPLSGHLFVFLNRRGNQIRVLFWDRTGYAIFGKKLARGRFYIGRELVPGATHVEVEAAELSLMLEGIDLTHAARRKRWRPAKEPTGPSTTGKLDTLIVPPVVAMRARRDDDRIASRPAACRPA